MIAFWNTIIKTAFLFTGNNIDCCFKICDMNTKYFNVIPGSNGDAAILLYGDIGDCDKVDSANIVRELMLLQGQYSKIDVRINSNGGDVFNGMAIYNALKTATSEVTIFVDGVAASIAAIIALCGKPLYMSPYAQLMLHSVSAGTYGTSAKLRDTADQIDKLEGELARMIAERCHKSAEEVRTAYFNGKDHWIGANEALRLQLIDGIYDLDITEAPPTAPNDIYNYFNNRLEKPQNQENMGFIEDVRKIPEFADKADEKSILEHITVLVNKATKADALEKANKTLADENKSLKEKEVADILNKAVEEGRITQEQTAAFRNMMNVDRKSTEELLASFKPRNKRASEYIINTPADKSKFANKSWDEIDRDNKLAELKSSEPELFAAKYKEKFGVDYKE